MLNAFIDIWADSAIAQAKQLDLEAASGKWRGPLHGIPLAHKDCAILLQVLAGWDPRDASSLDAPVPNYLSALETAGLASRWAVLEGIAPCHPDITRVFESLIEVIQTRYGQVGRVQSNQIATCYAMADVFSKVEAATLHGHWMRERRDLYSQAVFSRTEPGLHVPAVRYLEALQMRAKILHEFLHGKMQDLDVLICPTMPIPVPQVLIWASINGRGIC